MIASLLSPFVALLVSAPQQALHTIHWEELGPAPIAGSQYTGRVSAVAVSATDPNRYYIGGADGGVWKTTNGGSSWETLTTKLPTSAIGALAVDPTDHDVVYAGTGEANYANHSRYGLGLFKTLDGGETWEHLGESTFGGRTFSRIVIDPSNTQTVYAAIARAGGFPELAAAKGHPNATGERGVFKSTDGGQSWLRLTGLPNLAATDLAMDAGDPQTLYAGIGRIFGNSQNGVWKTTNGGTTWIKLGGGLPTGTLGRISLASAPSQPGRVYALITNPSNSTGSGASTRGAYRTNNGGSSWTQLGITGGLQGSFGWYYSVVGVNPSDSDNVLMGGVSLQRSTNAGSNWSTVTPPHVDQHALTWDASGRLLAGDDGGLHRSANLGSSWSSLNNGLGLIQLYAGLSVSPTDDETFFGGFQDNGTNRRNAPGTAWTHILGGDGGWTQVDPTNASIVFAEFQGTGNLYRSTSGGSGFSGVGSGISGSDRNCFLPPYLIEAGNPSRVLYATQRVYRSTNGGLSFSPISGDLTGGSGAIRCLAQSRRDPLFVYAATNDGRVLRSQNGGASFALVLSGQPGWPRVTRELSVHPTQPMTVYLAGASYGVDQVRRSTDGGTNWTSLDGNLPDIPVNVVDVLRTPRGEILFAGSDQGLFHSADDGQHWTRYGRGLPRTPVIDIRIERRRGRIVVATQGRGVWRAPLVQALAPK